MRLARPLACHANLRAPDSRVLIASREQARSGAWSRRAQYNHGSNHVQGRSAASRLAFPCCRTARSDRRDGGGGGAAQEARSEEHTSELQSLMRISYAVFCLKKKKRDRYKRIHQ